MGAQKLEVPEGPPLDVVPENIPQIGIHRAGVGMVKPARGHTDVVGDGPQLRLPAGQRLQRDPQTAIMAGRENGPQRRDHAITRPHVGIAVRRGHQPQGTAFLRQHLRRLFQRQLGQLTHRRGSLICSPITLSIPAAPPIQADSESRRAPHRQAPSGWDSALADPDGSSRLSFRRDPWCVRLSSTGSSADAP